MSSFISKLKQLAKRSPIPLSKNHLYDLQTQRIIRSVLTSKSCCIDVGCHKGEIMDLMIAEAPEGIHYGFEPIPQFHEGLVQKYIGAENVRIINVAASDEKGTSKFNFVTSNPSYSGLKKREYDRGGETDELIEVQTDLLDNIIPSDLQVDLIKIDVEGAELLVLKGARQLVRRCLPTIIFEHGLGASDVYGATPGELYDLLIDCGLKVSTLGDYLSDNSPLSRKDFESQYFGRVNYYFIAYPWHRSE